MLITKKELLALPKPPLSRVDLYCKYIRLRNLPRKDRQEFVSAFPLFFEDPPNDNREIIASSLGIPAEPLYNMRRFSGGKRLPRGLPRASK